MILFLTNADTEVLGLRTITEGLPDGFPELRAANPHRLAGPPDLKDVRVVVVRLLGGRRAWEEPFDALAAACRRQGVPLLAFGGEATPDAEPTAALTVPSATVTHAFAYLVQGGPANLEHFLRFVADTVLMEGFGFDPPLVVPGHGVLGQPTLQPGRPTVGVVFYRAHLVAGNTRFVEELCEAVRAEGANALPVYCYSLREPGPGERPAVVELLATHGVDAVVTTVLAAGSFEAGADAWDPGALASLDVPVVQGICGTTSSDEWEGSVPGLSPVDVAMSVAIPEFDGRIVAVPFSFKEQVDDGDELGVAVTAYRTLPDRLARVAGLAVRLARLRSTPPTDRRVALVLSAYPTKRSRLGNAVGLDTPASVLALLHAMREAGYRVDRIPGSGDELMAELADTFTYGEPTLTAIQVARAVGRWSAEDYAAWFAELPAVTQEAMVAAWGDPPGNVYVDRSPGGAGSTAGVGQGPHASEEPGVGAPGGAGSTAGVGQGPHASEEPGVGAPGGAGSTAGVGQGPHASEEPGVGAPGGAGSTAGVGQGPHASEEPGVGAPGGAGSTAGVGQGPHASEEPGVGAPGGAGSTALVFSGIDLGGVLVTIQPPRGFGEDPIAAYHSPDLPPPHHYLGFYRWLDREWGADAVVHVGKHGTLEWLPGKGVGLSAGCFPDAALGSLPLVYPFVVNDPGEGTQAKRRAHATVVDHLVPPLTRADTYDDLARLEGLLDQHAQLLSLDPSKLPAIRRQVWDVLVEAEIHRDLGLAGRPATPSFDDPAFDDLLLEVDGYLCELKDAQIRGGLHVLGSPPEGEAELDMVAAVTRLPQGGVVALRDEVAADLGVALHDGDAPGHRRDVDQVEAECLHRLTACQQAGWRVPAGDVAATPALRWACDRLVPALQATTGEIGAVLDALDGRYVPPGPSGAPSRGMAHVLPTGRNFYSVDPKAIPSRLAWDVGRGLADRLVERHLAEEGRYPSSVGLVVWGTSAMRTGGDDVAEALALLGVRPRWAPETGRVAGIELMSLEELGRPRVDVTLRVSGFFRDAFPHVLDLLDQAVALAAGATGEPADQNPVAASGTEDPRVFGPKPGAYGSGILNVLESGAWRGDEDLAAVYLAWGGWAYGRGGEGRPAPEALRRRLAAVEVAVKNQDNREHDIFDSDDYLQDHGGMVAAIRVLSGRQPKAWFGDSADPSRPRVRSLAEEAARVVRSRVLNPKWLAAMERHGYKGAFEMSATVDYLFGYDATTGVVEDWMYERVTEAYVGDPAMRKFFEESNPWALRAIAERLLEASERGLWSASDEALGTLRAAVLEAEGWEEGR